MTYNKPEIVNLRSSIKAIQGVSNKPNELTTDTDSSSIYFGQPVASSRRRSNLASAMTPLSDSSIYAQMKVL